MALQVRYRQLALVKIRPEVAVGSQPARAPAVEFERGHPNANTWPFQRRSNIQISRNLARKRVLGVPLYSMDEVRDMTAQRRNLSQMAINCRVMPYAKYPA